MATESTPRVAGSTLVRCVTRACAPVDIASLACLRIALALVLFGSVTRFWARGWIDELYVAPTTWLPYWGFEWIAPLPGPAMHAVFAGMAVCALLVAIGLCYRIAAAALLVAFTYVELLDATNYLNHYYLVSLLLVGAVLAPLGRAWSVDVRLRPSIRREHVPAWMLGAVRLQLGLVYFFAGVAKLSTDWLVHAQPLRLWLPAHADAPLVGPLLALPAFAHALSIAGAVFDLLVFPALCWRRTRPFAYAGVVVFHLATGALFPIGVFPVVMIVATTVFFAPDWPRRLLALRWPSFATTTTATLRTPSGHFAGLGACVLGLWFGLQLALPLRGLAYAGDVGWHEQGHRWAWRVMVVEKHGLLEYRVVDPKTGRTWHVDPGDELTKRQQAMLAVQPDLILRHAHRIAARWRDVGVDVRVYADAFVAYDGRPSARLIDPDVDLAARRDGLARYDWVLPVPAGDPP